jgi:hypothetical protein
LEVSTDWHVTYYDWQMTTSTDSDRLQKNKTESMAKLHPVVCLY